jgi:hypothetical protein
MTYLANSLMLQNVGCTVVLLYGCFIACRPLDLWIMFCARFFVPMCLQCTESIPGLARRLSEV